VFDLSPTKLLILFVVLVVVLGPRRLAPLARQLGAAWRRLCELRRQLDEDVHRTVPYLPSTPDLVRLRRSPLAILDRLGGMSSTAEGAPTEVLPPPLVPGTESGLLPGATSDGAVAVASEDLGAARVPQVADATPTGGDPTMN
jgi:hypothetical protein